MDILKQNKPYKITNFDFMNSDLYQFVDFFIDVKSNHRNNSLHLSHLTKSPWKRLKNILSEELIEKLKFSSSYKCPINGYEHYSLIPVSILTDNPEWYIKAYNDIKDGDRMPYYTEWACDPDYGKDFNITDVSEYLWRFDKVALGPGHTQTFYINDGYSDDYVVGVELENNDIILFVIKKWFNK